MFQQATRLILLFLSVLMMMLAIVAKDYYPSDTNNIGFVTCTLAIFLLLPWYRLQTRFSAFSKKPEFLAIGVGFFLVTVWLWIY